MENKYLPIGTVCSLKNTNKKIMIISYFSIEYNNNAVMYDYKGCVYPEGLLLPQQAISFNHTDIISIDYMGYKNEQYQVFNDNLNREKQTDTNYETKPVLKNFQFDENGVVIFDPTVPEESNSVISNETISNPFQVNELTPKIEEKTNIFDRYKFDENGVVISDETVSQPPRYTFDENGFVIGDNTVTEEVPIQNQGTNSKYQFDENGTVIGDNTVTEEVPIQNQGTSSKYQFDENGMVIGENTDR